jgi:type I restriction enzyme, S subunit
MTPKEHSRPGYKQTEAGVIPEDWEAAPINALCILVNGRGFKPFEWGRFGYPIIRIQNLNGSDEFNYYAGHFDPKLLVENGQLLFAWSGSRGTSFGPHVWQGQTAVLNYHTWKIASFDKKIDARFFFHALRHLTKSIEDAAHGASALVHTQKREMEKYVVPIPQSLPEQRTIAAVLSDADTLIASIDALIAKKHDVKRAAMQQLLAGKTRLPGFGGKWLTTQLGDVATIRNEKINTFGAGDAEFCVELDQIGQNTGRIDGYVDARNRVSSKYHFRKGDVLFGRLRPYLRKFWIAERNGVCSTEIWPLIPIAGGISAAFLFQTVQTDTFLEAASAAYGTHMPRADWGVLRRFVLNIPSEIDEQTAIAIVLSDMDSELAAVQARRDKAITLKQGMMQELLTGRVRLK